MNRIDADLRAAWHRDGWHSRETIGDELAKVASARGDLPLRWIGRDATTEIALGELYVRSVRLAVGLRDQGLREGDVVACQLPNSLEFALLYCASMIAGMVFLPIVHYYSRTELDFILSNAGARCYVAPDRYGKIDYRALIADVPAASNLAVVLIAGDPGRYLALEDLEAQAKEKNLVAAPNVTADDRCVVVYTSGTTANPKGVQHTHNTLLANVRGLGSLRASGTRDVSLGILPSGHVAGVMGMNNALFSGAEPIFLDEWDPDTAVETIERYGVTGTSGSAFFIRGLLDAARRQNVRCPSMEQVTLGAAGVPPSLVIECSDFGWPAVRSYGSSEQLVATTCLPSESIELRAHTDGRPIGAAEIAIADEAGELLPVGQTGEIVMRGPTLFLGYLDPVLNEAVFIDDGWFRTGDIGHVDKDRYLTVTDRKKDIIIRGGENISSLEVEEVLNRLPEVAESAVIAVPDERYGERVGAVVVVDRRGEDLTLGRVLEHFRAAGLAKQKTPERVWITTELPRTAAGKVKKDVLRSAVREQRPPGTELQ